MGIELRFTTLLAPSVFPAYRAIVSYLGESLGVDASLSVGSGLRSVDDADLSFICGLPYVLLMRRPDPGIELIAAPVLRGARYKDRPIYYSDVIVHTESAFQSFIDLKGASFCYNEPLSQSGYGVVRDHLIQIGQTGGFFGEVSAAGYHDRSIDLVAEGRVEASAIDSQVLEIRLAAQPEVRDQIRIVDTLGPSTIQPLVASASLDPTISSELKEALLEAHFDERTAQAMEACEISRWSAIEDSDYDGIRSQLHDAETLGFMEIR